MSISSLAIYVQEQGAYVGKRGKRLIVKKNGEVLAEARLKDTSQLVLCGNVSISAQTIHLLCEVGIPVVHLSTGNWFYGITSGLGVRIPLLLAGGGADSGTAAGAVDSGRDGSV